MIALTVMLAAPTTPVCYIMAKSMHNDGELTSDIVVSTTSFCLHADGMDLSAEIPRYFF